MDGLRDTALMSYNSVPKLDAHLGHGVSERPDKLSYKTLHRRNIEAICFSLVVPCILFSIVYAAFSFNFGRALAGVVGVIALLACGALAYEAVRRKLQGDVQYETIWYVFLFLTSVLAFHLAIAYGLRNYNSNMAGYYGLQHLNEYKHVDASQQIGTQFMDAGRVQFMPGSKIDFAKAMVFTNSETYCVAPITSGSTPLTYDFWAVGMNCCPSTAGSAAFQCGDYADADARSGLRVIREESDQYYHLAVQQAQAAFQLKTERPIFFHWTSDSAASELEYWTDTVSFYFVGVLGYICLQIVLVILTVLCGEKREEVKLLYK